MTRTRQRLDALEAQRGRTFADAVTKVVVCTDSGRFEYPDLATAKAAHPEAFNPEHSIGLVVNDGQGK